MLNLFIANLKMLIRNKQALFWSLMFPLMFTAIFGLFFGRENNVSGTIGVVNKSNNSFGQNLENSLADSKLFTIKDSGDENSLRDEVSKSKISAVLTIPENFGEQEVSAPKSVKIYSDPSNQASTILSNFVNQYLIQASFQAQNAKPLFTIDQESSGTGKKTNYFDFVMAGVLGLALMNASIMGMAVGISRYREDKILKRITTTPLKTWKFLTAEVLSRLCINIIQVALILITGIYVFHGHVYGNIFVLLPIVFLGAILFQLIGFAIAGFAKTADAAEGMAQAIAIPMMFLGGVFFPIDALPKWLYSIIQFLPLAPLLRMIRGISIDAISPLSNPINFIILLCWIIIAAALSIWKFRLNDE